MERLLSQQSEEDKILEARRKEHTDIHKDLASLKAFRADEDLCPSESYTSECVLPEVLWNHYRRLEVAYYFHS